MVRFEICPTSRVNGNASKPYLPMELVSRDIECLVPVFLNNGIGITESWERICSTSTISIKFFCPKECLRNKAETGHPLSLEKLRSNRRIRVEIHAEIITVIMMLKGNYCPKMVLV